MKNELPENFSCSDCATCYYNRCPRWQGLEEYFCEECPDFVLRDKSEEEADQG